MKSRVKTRRTRGKRADAVYARTALVPCRDSYRTNGARGVAPLPVQKLSGGVLGALLEVAHSAHLPLPQAHVEGQRTDTDI